MDTRTLTLLLCKNLNTPRFSDRARVEETWTLAECLQGGISAEDLVLSIELAIGEPMSGEMPDMDTTLADLAGLLVYRGHTPIV